MILSKDQKMMLKKGFHSIELDDERKNNQTIFRHEKGHHATDPTLSSVCKFHLTMVVLLLVKVPSQKGDR